MDFTESNCEWCSPTEDTVTTNIASNTKDVSSSDPLVATLDQSPAVFSSSDPLVAALDQSPAVVDKVAIVTSEAIGIVGHTGMLLKPTFPDAIVVSLSPHVPYGLNQALLLSNPPVLVVGRPGHHSGHSTATTGSLVLFGHSY